jgi:hypothetical protein
MVPLIAVQSDFRECRRLKPSAFGAAALLCLTLLALLVVVQVAHMHPLETDADHCPLCVAMQSAAPVAIVAAVVVLIQIEAAAPVFVVRAVVLHRHPKLYTRPPPVSC